MQDQINVELPFAKITLYVGIDELVESGALRFKSFAELPAQVLSVADAATAKKKLVGVNVAFTDKNDIVGHIANGLVTDKINEVLKDNGLAVGGSGPFGDRHDWFGMNGSMMRNAEISAASNGGQFIMINTACGVEIRSAAKTMNINPEVLLQPAYYQSVADGRFMPVKRELKGTFVFDGVEHAFTVFNRNYSLDNFMSDDDVVAGIYQEVYKNFPFVEKHNLLLNVHMD